MFSKVKAGGAGAGLGAILAGIIIGALKGNGIEVPDGVETLLTTAITVGLSIGLGYAKIENVGGYK